MDPGIEILGTWHTLSSGSADITFSSGIFQWGKDEGLWKVQGSQIWLLDPIRNTGTKWNVELEQIQNTARLILTSPENFHYHGRGQYFYFQMTPPQLTYRFERGIHP